MKELIKVIAFDADDTLWSNEPFFQEVEKQPELASDLRRFMNYYLPTTRKLVDAYREIELDRFRKEQNEKTN